MSTVGVAPDPVTFLCQVAVIFPTGLFFTACRQGAGQHLGKGERKLGGWGLEGAALPPGSLIPGLMEITPLGHRGTWPWVNPVKSWSCSFHPRAEDKCSSPPTFCTVQSCGSARVTCDSPGGAGQCHRSHVMSIRTTWKAIKARSWGSPRSV